MKRKWLVIGGIVLGVLVVLFIPIALAGPLLQRMGVEPFCIQGTWPHLRVVSCPEPTPAPPAVTLEPLPTLSEEAPIPIIVDDDGSPDGLIALLFFLRSPLFDVRAVTVSCGEAHPDVFADYLLQMLAGLGRPDIPVGAGRETPLEGDNAFPEPWREASDTFWGLALPEAPDAAEPVPAAQLIVETVADSAELVRVFLSGTHTNLAEALRLEPGIAGNIRDVHIMGGSMYAPGNIASDWPAIDNQVAEWNIWVDPVAAGEVFASGIPLVVMPLDATKQVMWTRSDVPGWAASSSAEGVLAADILEWMLDSWSPTGVFVWDLVAAVNAADPTLCPLVPLSVEVVLAPGPEQGRTAVTDGPPNTAVCLAPDGEGVKALTAGVLGR
jgi:pyrimidine-specific ribonucleoside hydrolase